MEPSQPHKRRRALFWLLLLLAVIPVFYLHLTALRAADDFYYSTFWMNGPAEFWRLTVHHYNAYNGRALVHFVAQTVLSLPPIVFAVVNTLLLCGTGALCAKLCKHERGDRSTLFTALFFLAQILLLSTPIITEGLLWPSASYNYMLPIFLIVLALVLLKGFLEGTRRGAGWFVLLLLAQFAAGATTEQCGFIAAAVMGVYGLCWAVQTKRGWWKLFLAPILNAAGYLTIFLSPATQARASGVKLEWEALLPPLGRMASVIFSWDGILLQILIAGGLLTLCLLIPKARRGLDRTVLSLLAGALAGALIMVPTVNFDPRVLLPIALLFMLVSARCAVLLLGLLPQGSLAPILCSAATLVACAVICLPLFIGVTKNYALELQNRAAVREGRATGVVHYSMDYDERWCYPHRMYADNNYFIRFLEANRITDCTVYMESKHLQYIYLNGQRLSSPAYKQNGNVLFPLRDIIEGFGGSVEYSYGHLTILLDGREVNVYPVLIAAYSLNGVYAEYDLRDKSAINYYKVSYTAEAFQALFHIDIRLEGDRYVCEKEPL